MKPMVSIWCQSYNHKDYIKDAIESFLMQETNFTYEIIIHDDASTDGTIDILNEYEGKYSNVIRVIHQEKNIYNDKNRIRIIDEIKRHELHGKYVAYCEGDDCWIDSQKLQKQVDYMEEHTDCAMITHNAIWRNCETLEERIMNNDYPSGKVDIKEVLYQSPVMLPTASIMLRKENVYMSDFFIECGVGDYPLKLNVLSKGYIYYSNEVMSIYRYMTKGSWTASRNKDYKFHIMHCLKMIDFLRKYNEHTGRKYEKYIAVQTNRYANEILARIKDLTKERYIELWKEINEETNYIYNKILEKIQPWYKIVCDEELYINYLKGAFSETDDIILWGTGRVTNHYLECLERHGLLVSGFVVTKRDAENEVFLGKRVWELKDLLAEKPTSNLVVAVWLGAWASILDTIFEYDIENYYYPFYYELD